MLNTHGYGKKNTNISSAKNKTIEGVLAAVQEDKKELQRNNKNVTNQWMGMNRISTEKLIMTGRKTDIVDYCLYILRFAVVLILYSFLFTTMVA